MLKLEAGVLSPAPHKLLAPEIPDELGAPPSQYASDLRPMTSSYSTYEFESFLKVVYGLA